MSALFVRAIVRSNPPLFKLLVRFNQQPATTLHDDHLPTGVSPQVFHRLLTSPRGERRLSAWVSSRYDLATEGFWRFEYPPQRLALLDSETLQKLVVTAGAAIHHQQVTGLIGGTQIRDVKQGLGEQIYQFAIKRASLLVGPSNSPAATSGNLVAAIGRTGLSCLRTCLGADSPELLRRVSLKLPKQSAVTPQSPDSSMDGERCWKLMKRVLLTEISPDLAPCFN
jgi:hypothetical protein